MTRVNLKTACCTQVPGLWNIDLLVIIKKQHQLDSNKLDYVAEHFLGDHKIDLSYKEQFALYRQGLQDTSAQAANMQKLGEYCIKDTELPLRLIAKLAVVPSMMEMASATIVPVDYLLQRGQSVCHFASSRNPLRSRRAGLKCVQLHYTFNHSVQVFD